MDKRVGENIRALRKAYGETAEELGAIIGVERSTIYSYETSTREPDKATLSKIANHYMISFEELLTADFAKVEEINVDGSLVAKHINEVFPVISTNKSLKNDHFKKAYLNHQKFYEGVLNSTLDKIDCVPMCIAEYAAALKDPDSSVEAAANSLALIYFMYAIFIGVPELVKTQSAAMLQAAKKDKKIRNFVNDTDNELFTEISEAADSFMNDATKEHIEVAKYILKNSKNQSDLGDYYIALGYVFNIVDNGLDINMNRRIGGEIMQAFYNVGNKFAETFIKHSQNTMGRSPQIVDDKG